MKRILVAVAGLALLVTLPGVATADPSTRPAGNQKFVDAVVARALSQRGVPFAYGGGDANGPSKGNPSTPDPATPTPGAQIEQQSASTAGTGGLLGNLLPVPAPAPAPPPAQIVGFDASGLMVYAFAGAGVKLPRTSGQQCAAGMKVAPANALPGDLVCYGPDGSQSVALFIGNNQMVEVTDTGVAVSTVRTNGMTPYLTRIIA